MEVRDPQAEEGEAEDQLREEGAAEAALHPEAAEAVAAVACFHRASEAEGAVEEVQNRQCLLAVGVEGEAAAVHLRAVAEVEVVVAAGVLQ